MRVVLFVVAVSAIAACVLPTEGKNPRCWYPGDTIQMKGPYQDGAGHWTCTWYIEDHIQCLLPQDIGRAYRFTASDCMLPKDGG